MVRSLRMEPRLRLLLLPVLLLPLAAALLLGCGPAVDRERTLGRLRAAITEEIATPEQAQAHNDLVVQVREAGLLEGLRMHEVQEWLGRGQQCGARPICAEHGFRPDDWIYEVGRQAGHPALPAGPTLIVGFGQHGVVDRVYTRTR